MKKPPLRVVFTGHIDHCKSTLIGQTLFLTNSLPGEKITEIKRVSAELGMEAELAFLTDYLEEERERNITIDTTQIFFRSRKRNYVIIDAPGHLQFIRNMLTGASQADAAVLIVDAAEGVQEQTRRHAYLVHLLGIWQIVVVVNKMDLVGYSRKRFDEVKRELNLFLRKISLTAKHSVPVSAKNGINITGKSPETAWYEGPTFLDALDSIDPPALSGETNIRFPVQDVYAVQGEEVAVGRLECGTLHRGQAVLILPERVESYIRQVVQFGREKKTAGAGESIGIVLDTNGLIHRGCVLVPPNETGIISDVIRVRIFWMREKKLEAGEDFSIQCATQKTMCAVERIEKRIDTSTLSVIDKNGGSLHENEVGEVLIKCSQPIVHEPFALYSGLGRLVLTKENETVAAGIVIEGT